MQPLDLSPFPFLNSDNVALLNGTIRQGYRGLRFLGFVIALAGLDLLAFVGSLGFRALNPRRGGGIQTDTYSRAISVFGYLSFLLLLVFAINYGSVITAVTSAGILLMQLVGERLSALFGTARFETETSRRGGQKALTWLILDLGLFAAIDIIATAPGSLPGVPVTALINTSNFGNALTVSSLITIQIAIAEETLFRGGIANLGAKYGGPLLGVLSSAVVFAIYHVPAEGGDLLKLGIIAADGAVLAYGDFQSGRILPSLGAHLINNLLFVLVLTGVFGVH